MKPQPYEQLTDNDLLWLCVYREARNQSYQAQLAVAQSILNRVAQPDMWWARPRLATVMQSVILKKWQYSSFNSGDPNANVWPPDDPSHPEYAAGQSCLKAATEAVGMTATDCTLGATNYYDTSISFPAGWGAQDLWVNTLDVGRLRFWKLRTHENGDSLEEA